MFLSDKDLIKLVHEKELLSPFISENCEGATIDLTLNEKIKKFSSTAKSIILGQQESENDYEDVDISQNRFELLPGESVLIQSQEYFKIPEDMIAVIFERYSIKLTGLSISPASYMNPGYQGRLSFVATNHSPRSIIFVPNIKFCQLSIAKLSSPSEKPYSKQDARYMGSKDVNISKLHLDKEVQQFLQNSGLDGISDKSFRQLGDYLAKLVDNSSDKIAIELEKRLGAAK